MTPFLQLRLWWLRAASGDKVAATLAALAVVALGSWILVPTTSGSDDVVAGAPGATVPGAPAGSTPGATVAPGAPGATVPGQAATPGSTGGGGGTAPSGAAPGPGGQPAPGGDPAATGTTCPEVPDGTPGVSEETITIDVAVLDLAGPIGNGAVGQLSADEQEAVVNAVVEDINARGGVACRTLEARIYKVNPISPSGTQAACIDMVQERPAMVVDAGGLVYGNAYNCTAQQQVPTISIINVNPNDVAEFFPFLASPSGDLFSAMRAGVQGLGEQGYFDPANGFQKLGVLMDECSPDSNEVFLDRLGTVGISRDQVSVYTFACPESGFASPADMAQAVTQHRAAGVSHVVPLTGSGSFNNYTETAERQGFRPRYGVTDYNAIVVTAASNLKPNSENFEGSLAITTTSYGASTTEGLTPTPGTDRCAALAGGHEAVYSGAGAVCATIWAAEAALGHAASLAPDGILPGLFNAGPVEMTFPVPDVTFQGPGKLHGGDTYWPMTWHKDCVCWHVVDPNRRATPAG